MANSSTSGVVTLRHSGAVPDYQVGLRGKLGTENWGHGKLGTDRSFSENSPFSFALYIIARLPRVIAVDTPHHVTQRGNARQFILDSDADRRVYWQLLQRYSRLHGLSLIGYCLMSNHVHLIVVPRSAESLATALKDAHGRYATYFNARHSSSGHVWQGRYFSCPLDPQHLWAALRYTELNPVRARLVAGPNDYQWSSAALHFGSGIAESEGQWI